MSRRRPVEILHTSDLHIGLDYGFPEGRGPRQALRDFVALTTRRPLAAAVIAGDFFDNARIPVELIEETFGLLGGAGCTVIILPGNHDPAGPGSVYRRALIPGNVHVLTDGAGELVQLDDIEVWGQAHTSYFSFRPLSLPPRWTPGGGAWRVALAHGHFADCDYDRRYSYGIEGHELAATGADYVALGHWDLHQPVGSGRPPVYYSGSPCRTGRFALVSFGDEGVAVREVAAGDP